MDVGELRAVILREEKPVPEGDEKDVQFKERLKEVSRECCTVLYVWMRVALQIQCSRNFHRRVLYIVFSANIYPVFVHLDGKQGK